MLLYGNQMHGGEGSDNVLSRHLSFSDLIVLLLVNSVNALFKLHLVPCSSVLCSKIKLVSEWNIEVSFIL